MKIEEYKHRILNLFRLMEEEHGECKSLVIMKKEVIDSNGEVVSVNTLCSVEF